MSYNWYIAVALLIRTIVGLALSLILGTCAMFVIRTIFAIAEGEWSRLVFTFLWFSSVGIGGGLGGFIAWLNLENVRTSRKLFFTTLGIVLLAAIGGAWGGYFYKVVLTDSLTPFTGRAVTSTAIFGAAVAANLVAVPIGLYWRNRHGW